MVRIHPPLPKKICGLGEASAHGGLKNQISRFDPGGRHHVSVSHACDLSVKNCRGIKHHAQHGVGMGRNAKPILGAMQAGSIPAPSMTWEALGGYPATETELATPQGSTPCVSKNQDDVRYI